jgi:NAD-dependent SIR2 family protein deacetylase
VNSIVIDTGNLEEFIRQHPRLVVLTGAGISASSGIPTYRDKSGKWLYSEPIQHRDFLQSGHTRRRYWARSMRGWPNIRDAAPNGAHHALAALERQGHIELLITQNVDRLHQRAGSRGVVDLHGRLDRVICLGCEAGLPREQVQQQLIARNSHQLDTPAVAGPDGDTQVNEALAHTLTLPDCPECGGDLMPDVVFFGGTVPRVRVDLCQDHLRRSDGLLVVGSSIQVYSGFRFCRSAHELGKPVALINPGQTRADGLASLKLQSPCEPLLQSVATRLSR